MDTFVVGNTGEERYYERGVSARHVTMSECIFDIESVLVGIQGEFERLRQNANSNRDEKHEVWLKRFHRRTK